MVHQSRRVERRLPTERSVREVAGRVFLATVVAVAVIGAAAVLFAGLPYYTLREAVRPDHPLHGTFGPGGRVGVSLGIVGAAAMVFLLSYSLRKWLPFLAFLGSARFWMRFHLVCGLLGPLFVLLHGAFVVPSGFIGVGFWCMWLVAASGFFGRYLLGYFPAAATDRRLDLHLAQARLTELRAQLVDDTRRDTSSCVADAVCLARDFEPTVRSLWDLVWLDAEIRRRTDLIRILLHRARLGAAVRRQAEQTLLAQLALRRSIAGFDEARRLLRFWNLLHQPLALAMYCIAALHILNAVLFGGVVPTLLGVY